MSNKWSCSYRRDIGGNFRILFNDADVNRPSTLKLDCIDKSNNENRSRELRAISNGTYFRDAHEKSGMGLPIASFYSRLGTATVNKVRGIERSYHPSLIHFPASSALESQQTIPTELAKARLDWDNFKAQFCARQSFGNPKKTNCDTRLVDLMREEDLKIYTLHQ